MTFSPTPEQVAILGHDPTRHARVLAGPGTGKSTTMVAFLSRLLEADPDLRVRMLTFTRAATAELAEKVAGHAAQVDRPSTVHSFAISILLRNPGSGGFPEPLRILDAWEEKTVIRPSLAKRMSVPVSRLKVLLQEMAANWESLTDERDPGITDTDRGRFRGAWKEHRTVFGYTLLAELPYAVHEALAVHDLEGLDFQLLIVDEYQDLNACDLAVIRRVSEKTGCPVIAVGDDDQSIYSWRKAAPEGIRKFLGEYAGATDYSLSVTLRCGKRIIDWANGVIVGDPDRPVDRALLAPLPSAPDGEVALLHFRGHVAEAKGVAALVHRLITVENVPPREVLVLMRADNNGTFSGPIRDELRKLSIQSSDPASVLDLLGEDANRRWIELLRLMVNPADSVAWASILHLREGVGKGFTEHVYSLAKQRGTTFATELRAEHSKGFPGAPASCRKAKVFIEQVDSWLAAVEVPEERPEGGWSGWVRTIVESRDDFPKPSTEFLSLLADVEGALDEEDLELSRLLGQIEPVGRDLAAARGDGVRLMTMTGSKGLTVRATVLVGVEDALVPRPKCDIAEERRILYVAMTRAKHFLFCTWARQRRGPTARSGRATLVRRNCSSFLRDLPVRTQDGERFLAARWPESSPRKQEG